MKQTFECEMTTTIRFNALAESEEEMQFWIQTHTMSDVIAMTTMYDIEYDDRVIGDNELADAAFEI